ncbi:hypothetical protein B0H17DRAFT_1133998 [Mycena rosella]|uniref:Uncharacterized protein n=1 Tax=Mycena rosella TaxID=1033263 RepID=A0AAD7FL11_MYCRO|nr:hypothetical protein B0H17DRAFT_1151261 [Mycena rosella]KAJ7690973.1 hypothetical protein B0H17DRAFT_1133998 [Mycena rosella]
MHEQATSPAPLSSTSSPPSPPTHTPTPLPRKNTVAIAALCSSTVRISHSLSTYTHASMGTVPGAAQPRATAMCAAHAVAHLGKEGARVGSREARCMAGHDNVHLGGDGGVWCGGWKNSAASAGSAAAAWGAGAHPGSTEPQHRATCSGDENNGPCALFRGPMPTQDNHDGVPCLGNSCLSDVLDEAGFCMVDVGEHDHLTRPVRGAEGVPNDRFPFAFGVGLGVSWGGGEPGGAYGTWEKVSPRFEFTVYWVHLAIGHGK